MSTEKMRDVNTGTGKVLVLSRFVRTLSEEALNQLTGDSQYSRAASAELARRRKKMAKKEQGA